MEQPTRTDGQIDPVPVPPGIETDTSLFKELGEVPQRRDGPKQQEKANAGTFATLSDLGLQSDTDIEDTYSTRDFDAESQEGKVESAPVITTKTIHADSELKQSRRSMRLEDKASVKSATKEPETVTPNSLYTDHIVRGDSSIPLSPCSVMVSGTKQCEMLSTMKHLFIHISKIKEGLSQPFSDFEETIEDSLYNCVLIIIGQHPYKNLHWLISSEDYAVIVCLFAYFENVYKKRNYTNVKQLEFDPAPNEALSANPIMKELMQQLHRELKTEWDKLGENECLGEQLLHGVTLINVFGIGNRKSIHDFLPFLNKYCKRSMHLTCYSAAKDADDLTEELKQAKKYHYCSQDSKTNHLFKQLKGCVNEGQTVVETIITDDGEDSVESAVSSESPAEDLQLAIKEKVRAEHIERLFVSKQEDQRNDIKTSLEKFVTKSWVHSVVYLRELLLLQAIRKSSNTFWMKRAEIESLAAELKFVNGSLDRFLQFFTSFGSIFYTHDIPALDDYVIIDIMAFVRQIHELHRSKTTTGELAKYGLFQYDDHDEDKKILFKFLTVLGIAVKVRCSQIQFLPSDGSPRLDSLHATDPDLLYCYVPSARSAEDTNDTTNDEDSIVLSFNESVAENLQACLCNEVLRKGGYLLATESPKYTTVRANQSDPPVQLTDFGKDVKITITQLSSTDRIDTAQRKIEIFSHILSEYHVMAKSGAKLRYQILDTPIKEGLVRVLEEGKDRLLKIFASMEVLNMVSIAAKLAVRYKLKIAELTEMFGIGEDQLKEYESYDAHMTVLCVMLKAAKNKQQFVETLEKLNVI